MTSPKLLEPTQSTLQQNKNHGFCWAKPSTVDGFGAGYGTWEHDGTCVLNFQVVIDSGNGKTNPPCILESHSSFICFLASTLYISISPKKTNTATILVICNTAHVTKLSSPQTWHKNTAGPLQYPLFVDKSVASYKSRTLTKNRISTKSYIATC